MISQISIQYLNPASQLFRWYLQTSLILKATLFFVSSPFNFDIQSFTDLPYCPVRLTKLYLLRLGGEYSEPKFLGFLVPRVRCTRDGIQTAEPHQKLSYTTAAEDFKLLLNSVGIPPKHYTEHSGKRGAATVAADMGVSTSDLQRMGGWASSKMAAKYTDLSVTKRLLLAEQLHGKKHN